MHFDEAYSATFHVETDQLYMELELSQIFMVMSWLSDSYFKNLIALNIYFNYSGYTTYTESFIMIVINLKCLGQK